MSTGGDAYAHAMTTTLSLRVQVLQTQVKALSEQFRLTMRIVEQQQITLDAMSVEIGIISDEARQARDEVNRLRNAPPAVDFNSFTTPIEFSR